MDLVKLKQAVDRVYDYRNIHQHLDLIAGLPYENYESFMRSFDDVYPDASGHLQMGFLKVLKGSYMEEQVAAYDLKYRGIPPYEVLSTKWLPYSDVIRLKGVEEMVEIYYNSGQFRNTVKELQKEFLSPFDMYESLREYYREEGLRRSATAGTPGTRFSLRLLRKRWGRDLRQACRPALRQRARQKNRQKTGQRNRQTGWSCTGIC